jgi:hypothetical protein
MVILIQEPGILLGIPKYKFLWRLRLTPIAELFGRHFVELRLLNLDRHIPPADIIMRSSNGRTVPPTIIITRGRIGGLNRWLSQDWHLDWSILPSNIIMWGSNVPDSLKRCRMRRPSKTRFENVHSFLLFFPLVNLR